MIIALTVIFFIICISAFNWKQSFYFVVVFLVLEGAVRKWIFPQASEFIYFLKDLVLIGAYFNFYFINSNKTKNHYINILIYWLAIWTFIQAFAPSLGSSVVGFFGLRAYLLYIPLIWMFPDLFPSKTELYKFIRNYSLLIIPVCLLAVIQFFSPPSSPLNVYAAGGDTVATFGVGEESTVRVTGSFSYITGFGTYLCTSFTLLIPLLKLRQSLTWYWLTIIELLLVTGTSFMTGSRAVVFYEALFLISYALILLLTQPKHAIRNIQKFILPIVIVAVLVPTYFSKSINLFSERSTANSTEMVTRIWQPFTEPFSTLNQIIESKLIDSYGTGATHQATPKLRKFLNLPKGDTVPASGEIEAPRLILEIGAFGFILWYSIRIALIVSLFLTFRKLRDPFLQQLALSAFLFNAIQIIVPVVFNPTMGIYYWILGGFIFLLTELEKREYKYFYYQQSDDSYSLIEK
ncbi:hypothetical protein VB735_10070 [Halotia wernerae UHCC 0503]|nr:hypothetical protein [Halotia wernerae UHCC 0503]